MSKEIATVDVGTPITIEQLKSVMPSRQKTNINQSLVDEINNLVADPEHRDAFRENILGYADVLKDPNTTMKGYVRAVKYCGYKMMGYTNQESWIKTHPDRYQKLIDRDVDAVYVRTLVCAYNKGKMVNKIMEQSLIPTWLINQDVYQKAINVQLGLMTTAKSEKVRRDAADSLLTHLKQPEASKITLDVNVHQDESIKELREVMTGLAIAQRDAIKAGTRDALEIAESKIITGESERIER